MKPGYFYFLKDITTEKQKLIEEEKQKLLNKLEQTDIHFVKKYMENIKTPENIKQEDCFELNCIRQFTIRYYLFLNFLNYFLFIS
jgi:hypothetical protein